jgi:putative selenate reductase
MCSTCDSVCPNRAILTYFVQPQKLFIPQLRIVDGKPVPDADSVFHVAQGPQVAVLTDACNECGNCVTFCPTADRPWRDKPRLYLHRVDFEAETDNAFMFIRHHGARGLRARFEGSLHQLIEDAGVLRYTSHSIELGMDADTLSVAKASIRSHSRGADLVHPDQLGAMIILHRSFAESMPEFPLIEVDRRQMP